MRKLFYKISFLILFTIFVVSYFFPLALLFLIIFAPIISVGLYHTQQKKKAVLRNFPILGIFRYLLEMVRPEIQQYFIESEIDGAPVPREIRSVVYQRAKQQTDTIPFGTQRNVYEEGYEWIGHSLAPKSIDVNSLRVLIGGPQCEKPYSASILNISAMSYGALSKNAVLALNGGAKMGSFYHNTGEGGISPYHLAEGGDLVWQIGTGYFGCRTPDGSFSEVDFKEKSRLENVKMIEIKLSQGAKPAHGGLLPAAKITQEIADTRKVELGKDVVSPPGHKEFSTPKGLLQFVAKLRDLSGGKPIGFKLCIGQPAEFIAICKAMIELKIYPDYIAVDGGEGGTGAAPLEFSNSVGAPLEEGLTFVHDMLTGFDLRKHIRVIATGKVMNGFNIFSRIALGADLCNSARGMMLALGCIQARRCNTNHCPTGVATSNEELMYGLDPGDKKVRVYNYHRFTVKAFAELLGASGAQKSTEISRANIYRRISGDSVKTYAALFVPVEPGAFLKGIVPAAYQSEFKQANPETFLLAA